MHLNKTILLFLLVISASITPQFVSAQTLQPSSLCVHTNDQLFLVGHGLIPGERITGFLVSSHYRSALWVLYPDTNGNLNADITFRSNIDMNEQRAVQAYYFSGQTTNAAFHVWYQTNNPTNDWQSVINSFQVSALSETEQQIDVYASVAPVHNNYQVQTATNLSGPWTFVSSSTTHENPYSNLRFGFQLPFAPQRFFRISNPYLPCPCDF